MDPFQLSLPALRVLPSLLLAGLVAGYLLGRRGARPATRLLGLYFAIETVGLLLGFLHQTILRPAAAYTGVVSDIGFLAELVVLVQFAYSFPQPAWRREARWALLVTGIGALLFAARDLLGAAVAQPQFAGGAGVYVLPPGALIGAMTGVAALLDSLRPLFNYLLYGWAALVLLRQAAAAAPAVPRAAWQRAVQPTTALGRAARLFAGVVVGAAICTALAQFLSPDLSDLAGLLVLLAFIVVHLNNGAEPSSFQVKLVGISLVTLLVILGLVNIRTLAQADQFYDQAHQDEGRQIAQQLAAGIPPMPPPAVAYIAARAGTGALRLLYARDPALSLPDLAAVAAADPPGPAGHRLYRDLAGDRHYLSYAATVGNTRYEVGYEYALYRSQMHTAATDLALILLLASGAILGIFPRFFQAGLVRPLTALQAGVRAVNAGRLDVAVPVQMDDEIGFLTQSFNGMVQSLSTAQAQLRAYATDLELANSDLAAINQATTRFVPHEFLQLLGVESIVDVQLGSGVQLTMSVLFADIRDFTHLAEGMSPQENFAFIGAYLQRVSPVIRAHGGFIDKYLGDGIMALFPGGADDAVQAAIALQQAVAGYNTVRCAAARPPIGVGIGVHTGRLMLGMVGEPERMDGTVIADAVNTAARLEGLTRRYEVGLIISEQTRQALTDPAAYALRPIGRVQVKGKEQAVTLYEVLDGIAATERAGKTALQADFGQGLAWYQAGRFAEAADCFAAALAHYPDDGPARLYTTQAAYFTVHGIPPGWMGVDVLDAK
ncbi:MAG: HAMP domain-containing protein [Chloroflexota bacterium]|nr:HAMP domain-containing protein [Chloroflexota bacterium]